MSTRMIAPTEAQFQSAVIEYARLRGWLIHHTRPAMRQSGGWSTPIQGDRGFPDLVLARHRRLIFAELKSKKGRITDGQIRWLDVLDSVAYMTDHVEAYVWRPDDWEDISKTLA